MAEKSKAIVKSGKTKKRELQFVGASSLMGVDATKLKPAEVAAHKARILVSKALGIPPNTVVILGNQPYVDNHGRKHKLEDYAKGAQFEYDYVQIATDDKMKAIVKCRVIIPNNKSSDDISMRPITGWVVGECSPITIKMGTLNGYQNHMAQTRAENRAFEAAYGTRFRKDLYEGVAKLAGKEPIGDMDAEVELALNAGNTSAEEAVDLNRGKKATTMQSFDPYRNASLSIESADTAKALEALIPRIKSSPNFKPAQVNKLLEQINEKITRL